MSKFIVTINRTCGSGGLSIAKLIGQRAGIACYDREILKLASEDSGINQELFDNADELTKKKPLFKVFQKVYNGEIIPPESPDYTSNDNLFNFQAKVLKELADRESFVVIGRCGDFVLKDYPDVLRVFIHAPYEFCVNREMQRLGLNQTEAEERVRTVDQYRDDYYRHHTGLERMDARNYDLSINTAVTGLERAADMILEAVRIMQE